MRKSTKAGLGLTTALGLLGGGAAIDRYALPHEETETNIATVDVNAGVNKISQLPTICANAVIEFANDRFTVTVENKPETEFDESHEPFMKAQKEGQAYVDAEYVSCIDESVEQVLNGNPEDLQKAIDEAKDNIPEFEPVNVTTTTGA